MFTTAMLKIRVKISRGPKKIVKWWRYTLIYTLWNDDMNIHVAK